MFKRAIAGAVVVLSVMPLTAQAQHPTDSTSSSSTKTEMFWQEAPALVPIQVILPPSFVAEEPQTLIQALHGYGSSAEQFRDVGERLAEFGFFVALPEASHAFLVEDGRWGMTGHSTTREMPPWTSGPIGWSLDTCRSW